MQIDPLDFIARTEDQRHALVQCAWHTVEDPLAPGGSGAATIEAIQRMLKSRPRGPSLPAMQSSNHRRIEGAQWR